MRTTLLQVTRFKLPEEKTPFKSDVPLKLKNWVTNKKHQVSAKGCNAELITLLSCLTKYDYENAPCSKEMQNFNSCVRRYTTNIETLKEQSKTEMPTPYSKILTSKQATYMLKKFPTV